ncbi:hypothetical protein JCM14469_38990 [Desulfatiferula olefinivorans]
MFVNLMLMLLGGLVCLSLYLMMAFLAAVSMENELPDLEDIQV